MDLRQLRTFHAVAELGSLSKASDRLRIAQPALSRQIKLLEHDLGMPLFVRHGRGMVPTEAGRTLFERTSGIVRRLEQAREEVMTAASGPSGRVVVGLVPTVSVPLAARLVRRVTEEHPGVLLCIVDAYGGHLVDWLHRGEMDLAVTYGPAHSLHLPVETVRRDVLMAVGAVAGPLASQTEVSIEWLASQPLILPSAPHGLRSLVDSVMAEHHLSPNVRVEADSFGVLLEVVGAGIGCTLLPSYAVADGLRRCELIAIPVRPALTRELVLAMPSQHSASAAVRTVAALIREEVGEIDQTG